MGDINIPLVITILALVGFSISLYIHHKKTSSQSLVCPFRSRCEMVIYSQYSKFFGIPLERIGMVYYGLIAICYALFSVGYFSSSITTFTIVLFALSLCAFIFSLYLILIQLFTLKEWCAWCMASALVSTLILAAAIINLGDSFIPLLSKYRTFITGLHLFGFALGLGGATVTDIFFFRFLKDFKISESEAEVLHTISQVIWFALGLLIISGLGLYLPVFESLNQNPKFLLKLIVVGVIVVNGFLLNLIVSPKLVKISFGGQHEHEAGELRRLRKICFALGSVSFVSWYSAFILGIIRSTPYSLSELLAMYIFVLLIVILISQLMERVINRKYQALSS